MAQVGTIKTLLVMSIIGILMKTALLLDPMQTALSNGGAPALTFYVVTALLLDWLCGVVACFMLARNKGRSWGWGLISLLNVTIGLFVLTLLSENSRDREPMSRAAGFAFILALLFASITPELVALATHS